MCWHTGVCLTLRSAISETKQAQVAVAEHMSEKDQHTQPQVATALKIFVNYMQVGGWGPGGYGGQLRSADMQGGS